MPKMFYFWKVFIRRQGLDIFVGEYWARSEREACNRARYANWGKNVPYDHIDGALFAKKRADVTGLQPRPRQRQLQF